MEFIQTIAGGDHSFIRELLTTFVSEVDSRLPRMEQALERVRGMELRQLVHSFVGTSGCVGAYELQERARSLENRILAASLTDTQESYELFHQELLRAREFAVGQLALFDKKD